jgi:hypothetical protein
MQTNKLLTSFEYAVMPSVTAVSIAPWVLLPIAGRTPLLQVKINFKNGEFSLKGNWHFIMASNSQAELDWYSYHTGIVEINANTYAEAIDLEDNDSDGLVFPVEGLVKDGSSMSFCTGLIQFDKINMGKGRHEWEISISLCDYQVDNCEIKFKLPLHLTSSNENNN